MARVMRGATAVVALVAAVAVVAMAGVTVHAQDMQFECITCNDVYSKCELDCVMPKLRTDALAWPYTQPETRDDIMACVSSCESDLDSCTDTEEATSCQSCVLDCATTYDTALSACLSDISTETSATYNTDSDYCANVAGYTMDSCRSSCSSVTATELGGDRFSGWSPETEEGRDFTGAFNIPYPQKVATGGQPGFADRV